MRGFALDIEAAKQWQSEHHVLPTLEMVVRAQRSLHNAVGCLGLDLKVGSGGVVEVFVEKLRRK